MSKTAQTKTAQAKSKAKSKAKPASAKVDLHAKITDAIIAQLETGVAPWTRPWRVGSGGGLGLPLRVTGQPYSGVNVLLLWMTADARGYVNPTWMTFKQAIELKGCVRKGETGAGVVYANRMIKTETDAAGEETRRAIPFLKSFTVFNVEQIDGLPERFYGQTAEAAPQAAKLERIAAAERYFAAVGAKVAHGGASAFYMPAADRIQMPAFDDFHDAESYYATLAHEHIHWTKAADRLDRDMGRQKWGDEGYAREELVAELGAAFLGAQLGLYVEPRADHAAYLAHWLKVLKDDKRAIFAAASHATKAVAFLNAAQLAQAVADGDFDEIDAPATMALAA